MGRWLDRWEAWEREYWLDVLVFGVGLLGGVLLALFGLYRGYVLTM